jgi:ribosomal protein S18 acetylase RimI-like enzyme
MQLVFKKCSINDLDQLVQISKSTFIDAFEADNNSDDFEAYIDFVFNKSKLTEELENPFTAFYFVYADNDLVGYIKLNENDAQSDLKGEDSLELERIYVIRKFQGIGLGKWMLQQVKKLASQSIKNFLWLGVWEHNKAAIKFYEINGFSKFGMHPYYIGKDKQMDWLMRFDLINFNKD